MSSPIALRRKSTVRSAMTVFHQRFSHNYRTDILSKLISDAINSQFKNTGTIRCLDVGCGDMRIAEGVLRQNPRTNWTCIDIHELPDNLKDTKAWAKYRKFDGTHIPFDDKSMDVVLFCDVLHHAEYEAAQLLSEAARVSSIVIIKDHFEYSLYSHEMLKLMDYIGNWGYGIEVPGNYFTRKRFDVLCTTIGLVVKNLQIGIDLYHHVPLLRYLLRPKWQFIAVLES